MFQDEIMLKELTQRLAYNVKVDFDKTVCQLISVQNTGTVILSDIKNNKILTTKLDNIKLYTYNVYRILFNGLFHISVFSASNTNINKAYDKCVDFVYAKNGKIATF